MGGVCSCGYNPESEDSTNYTLISEIGHGATSSVFKVISNNYKNKIILLTYY